MEVSNSRNNTHLHEVIFSDRHYINKLNQMLKFITFLETSPRISAQHFFMLIRPRGFGLSLANEAIESLLIRDELLMDHIKPKVADTISSHKIGTYPVLHFSFADSILNSKVSSIEDFTSLLAEQIQQQYWAHHVKIRHDVVKDNDLRRKLLHLIHELSDREHSSVVVICDNFDIPIYLASRIETDTKLQQALALYFEMLNALRQAGDRVKFCLMTGHVKFALCNELSEGIPHVVDLSFHDIAADLTGFTIEEIKSCYEEDLARIAPQQGVTISEYLDVLEHCYGGFVFSDRMKKVLSPLSVTRALDNDGELYAYSCNNNYTFAQESFAHADPDIDWLIDKDGQDLLILEEVGLFPEDKEFGSLLAQQGFVSVNKVTFADQEHSLSWRYRFGFTNVEMRRAFNIISGRARPELKELPINCRVYDAGEEEYAIVKEN